MPYYVGAFGSICAAVALQAAAMMPGGLQGRKPLAQQVWSKVTTPEASLNIIASCLYVLAILLTAIGGGFHANANKSKLRVPEGLAFMPVVSSNWGSNVPVVAAPPRVAFAGGEGKYDF